ncbi:MAG: DUF4175 family protein [Bacteroidota bacterium]
MSSPPPRSDVRQRLRAARFRWTAAETIRGVLFVVAGVGLAFLLGVAVEGALWLGVGLRTLLFWTLAALGVGLIGTFVLPPVLRGLGVLPGMDTETVAHRADRHQAGAGDRLLALLDLQSGRSRGAEPLQVAAAASLSREVADVPVEKAEDASRVRRALPWALVPVLGFILALVAVPGPFEAAAERLLSPGEAFYPPAPFTLAVEPGDVEVVRGQSLEVIARPSGRDWPAEATLEVQREGERATDETRLRIGNDSRWVHTVEDLRQTVRYRVRALGAVSPWYEARVVARPLVRGLNVVVVPPGYAGRESRALPEGVGDVTGLAGSTVRLGVGLAGEPTARGEVRIRWDDSTTTRVPLTIGAEGATARFVLRRGGTYSLHLETEAGVANTDPAQYTLGVLGDAPPQIALVDGASGPLSREPRRLEFRVTDDFGFAGGSLIYRVIRGETQGPLRRARLPVRSRPLGQDVAVRFQPPGLAPGDAVELFGEVVDNGPQRQRARTAVVTLRFPSLAQRIEQAEAQRDSTREALGDLREDAEDAAERFEQFRQELRRDPEPDYESRRQLEELRRRQDDLGRQSEQLQERMQQLAEDMQQSGLMDEETMRQMEQMQQVMQELDSPELREALRRLQEAMEQLDMRQMMEQVEQAEFNEEQFRERLERAMELLERLETAVDMEEAAALAEDLAEREAEIQEQTEALSEQNEGEPQDGEPSESPSGEQQDGEQPQGEQPSGDSPSREEVAQEQERAAEDAAELQRQMDEIREQMRDMQTPREAQQQMNQAQDQMQQQGGMRQQMQQNAQQIRERQDQEAQQGQQEMQRRLRRMAQQMREASQQMQGQQQQIDTARLRAALEDVLTLSTEQERLAERTSGTASRSPALRPLARRQSELRTGLQHVADSLRSISRTVPQLGRKVAEAAEDARRDMSGAVEELAEQRSGPAAARQRSAMTHLNELAVLLADVLQQQQQQQQSAGGSGQGMPQQMQQMGQQQQQLNQQIQQMLNETAGQRLSRSEQQRMRQLAEQQEAIRRQLNQMMRQGGGEGGEGGLSEQQRSALRRIEEQMGEAARELRRGRSDPQTLPRQQNILQKLLEAERSANEQGREEKREGETASDTPPGPRGERRAPDRPADRVRADLIRALESGYSADYQDLIKRYFDRLQDRVE